MTTQTVSIENVIGKILRDTKLTDMSYVNDMSEWIPEAMEQMNIRSALGYKYCILKVGPDGKAKLPKGVLGAGCVVYNKSRVMPWKSVRCIQAPRTSTIPDPTFVSGIARETVILSPTDSHNFWKGIVGRIESLPVNNSIGYRIAMGLFEFSVPNVEVEIHFWCLPTDTNGLPLIPDNAFYREALYWYVRTKLIGSGHYDPVYGRDDRVCMERWELNAGRAIGQLDYPTPDEVQAGISASLHMVFPDNYFENFFDQSPENLVL